MIFEDEKSERKGKEVKFESCFMKVEVTKQK